MIEIKRNVADDLRELAEQMNKEAYAAKENAEELRMDAVLLEIAADAQHRYKVMVDNGVNEALAVALAVALTRK